MLFVNDEFEGCQPVFSEPKKVHPETEDEITRRIKIMLGEYAHKDFQSPSINNKNIKAISNNSQAISKAEDLVPLEPKVFQEEKLLSHTVNNESHNIENMESCDLENKNCVNIPVCEEASDKCSEAEPCGINVRRSSLKRQCKEKISLLDYNPMFTIRTKRTKPNYSTPTSQKLKSNRPSDVLVEEKSSDFYRCNGYNESSLDNPPILDPIRISSNGNASERSEENSVDSCSLPKDVAQSKNQHFSNYGKFYSDSISSAESFETSVDGNSLITLKSKKQSKKKKRKFLYESASEDGVKASKNNGGDSLQSETEPIDGPCQIKNGIIKIRLSKLTDNKKDIGDNDYEVSLTESDALIGCKTLSVPLSPLAPAVYSAYCANLKSKKKSHSKKLKKKSKKDAIETIGVSELCKEKILPDICEKEFTEVPKMKDNNLESMFSVVEEVKSEVLEQNEDFSSKETALQKNSCSTNIAVDSKHPSYIINEGSCVKTHNNVVNIQNSYVDKHLLHSHPGNCSSPTHSILPKKHESEILCSINLTLLDRVPPKHYFSSDSPKQEFLSALQERDVKEEILLNSVQNGLQHCSQVFCDGGENPNLIKEERCSPPTCDFEETVLNNAEKIQSPVNNDIDEDEACPYLLPAYSYGISHGIENKLNSLAAGNGSKMENHQKSKLSSLHNDALPVLQKDVCDRIEYSLFITNANYNNIKHESADDLISNHKKWKEVKEYKWCPDFPDLNYNSNTLFKEQVSYNVTNHRIWQETELKKQYSSEYYLNEAKKLKHQADKEIDRMVQAMKYLEAVLYFILTGNAMEHSYIDTDRVHTMYKETLALIRFISSKFQKLHNASCRNIDNKLTVLSLRCQSLLYLKMYQLRRDEVRCLHRSISSFLKAENGTVSGQSSPLSYEYLKHNIKHSQASPYPHQASPCSLIPSPAESIASVGSQSSGYSSSELGWNTPAVFNYSRQQLPFDDCSDVITIARTKYKMLQQQSVYLANLHLSHDLWEHADYLSSKEHSREFFMELDEECGCLSLHSPFSALVHYVRKGLYKLKDGT